MNGDLALDTNAVIAYRADVSEVVTPTEAAERVFLPLPVLGEALYGAKASGRPAENLLAVHAFADTCTILEPDVQTAEVYADVRAELKAAGRPIPENDLWIAALCVQWEMPLLTRDRHFEWVAALAVQFWTLS